MKKRALTLQEHQEIIYELLYALDDFCKEHNIKYFLTGGTLLGAIRHQGIIPWDDDADVMMPRQEYEKFLKITSQEEIKGYKVISIYNTQNCYIPFVKFSKNNTLLIEELPYMPKEGIGINIDVFPLDGCPNDEKEAISYTSNLFNNIQGLLNWNFRTRYTISIKNDILHFLHSKSATFRKYYYIHLFNKNKKIPYGSTKFFSNSSWGWYGTRETLPIYLLKEVVYKKFGTRNLPVPKMYDEYLTSIYGDYMTPPPPEKRASTHQHGDVYIIEN